MCDETVGYPVLGTTPLRKNRLYACGGRVEYPAFGTTLLRRHKLYVCERREYYCSVEKAHIMGVWGESCVPVLVLLC